MLGFERGACPITSVLVEGARSADRRSGTANAAGDGAEHLCRLHHARRCPFRRRRTPDISGPALGQGALEQQVEFRARSPLVCDNSTNVAAHASRKGDSDRRSNSRTLRRRRQAQEVGILGLATGQLGRLDIPGKPSGSPGAFSLPARGLPQPMIGWTTMKVGRSVRRLERREAHRPARRIVCVVDMDDVPAMGLKRMPTSSSKARFVSPSMLIWLLSASSTGWRA